MATTRTFPPIVSKYNGSCTACGADVRVGDQVQWIKGVKGVTCLGCPPPGSRASMLEPRPTNGTTHTSAADPQLQAALADGQALRKRIGELQASLVLANETIALQSASLKELARNNDLNEREVTALRVERDGLRKGLIVHEHDQIVAEKTAQELLDGDLIDVMAPGGVERWLEHDLAQIAAEKIAKERQAIPTVTDDCPI
jgi:hypothetical protein